MEARIFFIHPRERREKYEGLLELLREADLIGVIRQTGAAEDGTRQSSLSQVNLQFEYALGTKSSNISVHGQMNAIWALRNGQSVFRYYYRHDKREKKWRETERR